MLQYKCFLVNIFKKGYSLLDNSHIIAEMDKIFSQAEERKDHFTEQILHQLTYEQKNAPDLSITEVHVISQIGKDENVNDVKLAKEMGMPRGGISKVVSSLLKKELMLPYSTSNNKKKIFYRLTPAGEKNISYARAKT